MFTKETIEQYFLSYKHAQLFLCIAGLVAIAVAAIFYWGIKKEYFKGMAIGMVSLAVAFCIYGYTNYAKANRIGKINTYNYDLHPEYLKSKELPRIAVLKKANIVIGIVFVIVLAVSFCLTNYYATKMKYLAGIFAAIFMMSVLALGFCYFVKNKTKAYESGIVEFTREIRG